MSDNQDPLYMARQMRKQLEDHAETLREAEERSREILEQAQRVRDVMNDPLALLFKVKQQLRERVLNAPEVDNDTARAYNSALYALNSARDHIKTVLAKTETKQEKDNA